jgi:glycosyltransferase involved in cell wall biosynthesis
VLLTIYIPTFKRLDIGPCLESIVPQLVDGVELIVSDNDPDGFAEPFVKRFPQVQYSKRLKNIDGDPNVFRGVTQGSGKYVWVFGDDDTMLPGTIEMLLPMLDGVGRVLHWTPNSREVNAGFSGKLCDYMNSLGDKSILVASTTITSTVWRRDAMNLSSGLNKLDTRYPLAWAGLTIDTIKVMPVPTITVGYIHQDNYFTYFPLVMDEYIRAWSNTVGANPIDFSSQANGWNFVSVSLEKSKG